MHQPIAKFLLRLDFNLSIVCHFAGSDDEDDVELGTEYLLKVQEKHHSEKEKQEKENEDIDTEMGTEFLVKCQDQNELSKELPVSLRSRRQRSVSSNNKPIVTCDDSSQGDEAGPSRQITDIAADAMSLQPTGYTLETAHVSRCLLLIMKMLIRNVPFF